MPRYAPPMTSAEFLQRLETYVTSSKDLLENFPYDPGSLISVLELAERALRDGSREYGLFAKVWSDWSKIEFSAENFTTRANEFRVTGAHIVGLHTLPNGMTYLGALMGGDWESPLFGIVYHDGKTFRGYIPTDGNAFNCLTKAAVGNDEDEDIKYLLKCHSSLPDVSGKSAKEMEEHIYNEGIPALPLDPDAILADVQKRILIKS
jgi:hypothetical protein